MAKDRVFRLEAEFYNADSIHYSDIVKGEKAILFSQYGTSNELNEIRLGYPVLRLNEFNLAFISKPAKYCDLLDVKTYQSLKLKKDDVLICRTNGNPKLVGKSAIVPVDYDYAFASYLFRVRPNKNIINSASLVAFLNSKYGRIEIEKYAMVGNQANFSPAKFREITIPILPSKMQQSIESYTYRSFDVLKKSEELYASAEAYLLEYLGMTEFIVSSDVCSVKTLNESFLRTGRLDAEYYQPKYEQIDQHIANIPEGCDTINNLFFIKDSNYMPISNQTYRYIELSNIGTDGDIIGHTEALGANLPSRARRIVHSSDIIVSSLEGSLQSCALISDDYNNAVCSTGFYVLSPKSINAETALVLFKSQPVQSLMARVCSGSIMAAMSTAEFANIKLPKIDVPTQIQIKKIIQESVALKNESKRLLDITKSAVEIAIEQGEEKALELLN